MKSWCWIVLGIVLPVFPGWGKTPQLQEQKAVQAVRTLAPIRVDGRLDEAVWQRPGIADFIQAEPMDGTSPTERTEVWVAYDNTNLYVAARLSDSDPAGIVSQLGRRDDEVDSDWFSFAVDPYYDRRSGYQFSVTPAGSIQDEFLYNDDWDDEVWDGIWESATHIDDRGWYVEMRIPFDQLRFQAREKYVWGVNFRRTIKRRNERDSFVWIPKGVNGYVSHFARLEGVENIHTGRAVELLPYTVGRAAYAPVESGDPFRSGHDYRLDAGLDLKVGLQSNLTLNATINPDFGQVEVDPAEVNLSAFETFYEEKRPFFIEGANIFRFGTGGSSRNMNVNWMPPNLFYSRRIGRPPQGEIDSYDYIDTPASTNIIGAVKVTGKIGGNWNIGLLDALTTREWADIEENGRRRREEVEPLTNYTVLRTQKEFHEGREGLGFMAGAVNRHLRNDGLRRLLPRSAYTLGVDGWFHLDRNRTWVITGWFGGSRVSGDKAAMAEVQQRPQHYFQRPDAGHLRFDPERTVLNGWAGRLALNKQKGNWQVNAALGAISPGFEANDLGFQGRGDLINTHLMLGYEQPHPGKVLRNWRISAIGTQSFDFGGNKTSEEYFLEGGVQLLNYWDFMVFAGYNPSTRDRVMTRGGPLMRTPDGFFSNLMIFGDSRKALVWSLSANVSRNDEGGGRWSIGPGLRWKPAGNVSVSLRPRYSFSRDHWQWVTNQEDPANTTTFGTRHIFAGIEQKTLSAEIRLNWVFTPKLSLQLYLQPLLSTGKYAGYKELARPDSREGFVYGENGSFIRATDDEVWVDPDGAGPAAAFTFSKPDFNYKSLRGTILLRWEYRPGSAIYLVWSQDRSDDGHPGDFRFGRDFADLLSASGTNTIVLKVTYRFKI